MNLFDFDSKSYNNKKVSLIVYLDVHYNAKFNVVKIKFTLYIFTQCIIKYVKWVDICVELTQVINKYYLTKVVMTTNANSHCVLPKLTY